MEGIVAVGANVRTGPGTDYAIVTSILAGSTVTIEGQRDGWYQVILPDETEGWMSAQVLQIEPEIATIVPTISAAQE
jgi:uncharacterized protein YgiM (DUF1202 family)